MTPPPIVPARPAAGWRAIPASVWALGFGSLLMDASSELIHALLPLFMVAGLGASMLAVGVIEGIAEATAALTKPLSGAASDYLGRRKFLMVSGYALAALAKPVFPLASSVHWVLGARFADRLGKGIRGAPRDALIADITPSALRGAAYGLRQALDSVGAVLGPALAVALMAATGDDIRRTMSFAVVPACLAVAVLLVYVREPGREPHRGHARAVPTFAHGRQLPLRYWLIVGLGAVFTLARFSEAFLVLRAATVGLAVGHAPVVMIVMNVVYAASAYPAGAAADRLGGRTLLLAGLAILVASDVVLALAASPAAAYAGAALWGLHMGLTQGLLSKLVAGAAPAALVGTAFGIFSLVSGGALLLASVIAGWLWSSYGPAATFAAGAAFAGIAAIGLIVTGRSRQPRLLG